MKNFLILVLCAALVAVFFACSNDGLTVKPPLQLIDSHVSSCELKDKCYSNVSEELCDDMGGITVAICVPSSSSVLSSSSVSSSSNGDGTNNSSSSSVISSSSSGPPKPAPVATGDFYFKFLNDERESPPIYFLANAANNMRLSTNPGGDLASSGKIYQSLVLSNTAEAGCVEPIQYKLTLDDILLPGQENLTKENGGVPISSTGLLAITAYANCDGVDKTLKNAQDEAFIITAKVIIPPKVDPIATGELYFKFLDNQNPPMYLLTNAANNMRLSTNAGGEPVSSGKIYRKLDLSNAAESGCANIQYKLTLNGEPPPDHENLTKETGGVSISSTGLIAVTAYANCDGEDKTLKNEQDEEIIITVEVVNAI
ncbi:MAG: hypothetical protein FWC15_04370 [Fibromonadales bacterium]|nr:hypothetical protein [Fibromonadales bacterium]